MNVENNLLFAVPKKGRIFEQCMDLLKGADIKFRRKHRLDIAVSSNLPITLVFLNAKDIPTFVGEGNIDLGITGFDMVLEAEHSENVHQLLDLGFGACKLQLQVPVDSEIKNANDLIGKRIVTSFANISKNYFQKIENSITPTEPNAIKTKISVISGSVEAACQLGLADAIIDLVESGETMRAAGLKPIDTIIDTESVLIVNKEKFKNLERKLLIEKIFKRLQGVIVAQNYVLVSYNLPEEKREEGIKITPGKKAPSIAILSPPCEDSPYKGWIAIQVMVLKKEIVDVMERLEDIGATDIIVVDIRNVRGVHE